MNGAAISLHKKQVEINGKTVKSGCYIFDTQDPNITIRMEGLPVRGENILTVRMELTTVPEDMARDMMGAVKKLF